MVEGMTCDRHGTSAPTVVCRHLFEAGAEATTRLDFITAFDPDEPRPTAWCRSCETVRADENHWSEQAEAEAGWIAICSRCYEEIRARHLTPP
jgi:hypothetical protein